LENRRLHLAGAPYHLVLMQLQHDSAFQAHSPFTTNKEFLDQVLHGFAKGAPRHHLLVIRAHPLEPDSSALHQIVCALAQKHQVMDRVRYIEGGKLAKILKQAHSAGTVNSTAGQQALWRGVPLKISGAAIYAKTDFTSQQGTADFFAAPTRPDSRSYRTFRRYLLETSQIAGCFYSQNGRRHVTCQVVNMMLSTQDPYTALTPGTAAPRQYLQHIPNGNTRL
jgi:capsular polysaccharide export protein